MPTNQVPRDPMCESSHGGGNNTMAIFLVSFFGLFLEMMLIRWVSTEVGVFAYLQNAILVVCFLGLGMGCFTCRKSASARQLLLPLVVLVFILAVPFLRDTAGRIGNWLSVLDDLVIWTQEIASNPWTDGLKLLVGLLLSFGLLVLLWEIFVPVGRLLGRLLDDDPHTIRAYSVNVAGSLAGIWLFALLSAWNMPPWTWALVCAGLLLPFLGHGRERIGNVALLGVIVVGSFFAGRESQAEEVFWSPYQKLVLFQLDDRHPDYAGKYIVTVNSVGYQGMIDLSAAGLANNPRVPVEQHGMSQYDVPTHFKPRPTRALVVGSGSGNDVAGALRGGAGHVTAVEIDPVIVELGKRHHPERPYDDPRVHTVIDDARSYFATTDKKYDLVIFGLLDSHTMTAMTNARLDHYVYTRESIRLVQPLLKEGGIVVLSFEAKKPYIADRMSGVLTEVFGWKPLAFKIPSNGSGWGGVLFVAGDRAAVEGAMASNTRLARQVEKWQAESPLELPHDSRITTDDWPYVYLESPHVPRMYSLLAVLLLALVAYASFRLRTPILTVGMCDRSFWHFFFLGAAFMLLEVQNISKASVVLGNTWQVNAVIVSGVLVMILLANLFVAVVPRLPMSLVGSCLIGSCAALYYFDLASLASVPYAGRVVLVGLLTTFPMFFSGILFMQSFAATGRKDLALGANLLGALFGGLIQSVTFAVGIKALLLVVAGLYLLALLARPRKASSGAESPLAPSDEAGSDRGRLTGIPLGQSVS